MSAEGSFPGCCCDQTPICDFALVAAGSQIRGYLPFDYEAGDEVTTLYRKVSIHYELNWRDAPFDEGSGCDESGRTFEDRTDTWDLVVEYSADDAYIHSVTWTSSCSPGSPAYGWTRDACGSGVTEECNIFSESFPCDDSCKDPANDAFDCFYSHTNALDPTVIVGTCGGGGPGTNIGCAPIWSPLHIENPRQPSTCNPTAAWDYALANVFTTPVSGTEFITTYPTEPGTCTGYDFLFKVTVTLSDAVTKTALTTKVLALRDSLDLPPPEGGVALTDGHTFGCPIGTTYVNAAFVQNSYPIDTTWAGYSCTEAAGCETDPNDTWAPPKTCYQRMDNATDPANFGRPVAFLRYELDSANDVNVGINVFTLSCSAMKLVWNVPGGVACTLLRKQFWDPSADGGNGGFVNDADADCDCIASPPTPVSGTLYLFSTDSPGDLYRGDDYSTCDPSPCCP